MIEKHRAVLDAISRVEERYERGAVPTDVISDLAGLDNTAVNNAFKRLEPEYLEYVGRMPEVYWDRGGEPPKLHRLTDTGREEANQYPSSSRPISRLQELQEEVDDVREYIRRVEHENERLRQKYDQLLNLLTDSLSLQPDQKSVERQCSDVSGLRALESYESDVDGRSHVFVVKTASGERLMNVCDDAYARD